MWAVTKLILRSMFYYTLVKSLGPIGFIIAKRHSRDPDE